MAQEDNGDGGDTLLSLERRRSHSMLVHLGQEDQIEWATGRPSADGGSVEGWTSVSASGPRTIRGESTREKSPECLVPPGEREPDAVEVASRSGDLGLRVSSSEVGEQYSPGAASRRQSESVEPVEVESEEEWEATTPVQSTENVRRLSSPWLKRTLLRREDREDTLCPSDTDDDDDEEAREEPEEFEDCYQLGLYAAALSCVNCRCLAGL